MIFIAWDPKSRRKSLRNSELKCVVVVYESTGSF